MVNIALHGGPFGGGKTPKSFKRPLLKTQVRSNSSLTFITGVGTMGNAYDLMVGGTTKFFVFFYSNATGYVYDSNGNRLASPAMPSNKKFTRYYPVRRPGGKDLIFAQTENTDTWNGPLLKFSEETNSWTTVYANSGVKRIRFSVDRVNEHIYIIELDAILGSSSGKIIKLDFNGNILLTKTFAANTIDSDMGIVYWNESIFLVRWGDSGNLYYALNLSTMSFDTTYSFVNDRSVPAHHFVDNANILHVVGSGGCYFTRPDGFRGNNRVSNYVYFKNQTRAAINDNGDIMMCGETNAQETSNAYATSAWGPLDQYGSAQWYTWISSHSVYDQSPTMAITNEGNIIIAVNPNIGRFDLIRGAYNYVKVTSPFDIKGRVVQQSGLGYQIKANAAAAPVNKQSGQVVDIVANTTELVGVHPDFSIITPL